MSATNAKPPSDPALAGESNVPRILGLGITFHALALVAFGLRMYTRLIIVKSFGKDDLALVLCMVSLLVLILTSLIEGKLTNKSRSA